MRLWTSSALHSPSLYLILNLSPSFSLVLSLFKPFLLYYSLDLWIPLIPDSLLFFFTLHHSSIA